MDLDAFAALLTPTGQALLGALPPYAEADALALGERLRRDHPAALVAAAMTQARLRARGRAKFGAAADGLYFTGPGLEQATRGVVAGHHAARFAAAGARRVADLCCGVGGDALAFAAAGLEVLAVDRDPLTAAVATANLAGSARATVLCADATQLDLDPGDAVFVDPSRRGTGGRVFDPRAYEPPLSFVVSTAAGHPLTAAKVAPGLAHHDVPPGAEAQWVSVEGDVVEAGLWFGPLAREGVRRSALVLAGGTATLVTDAVGGGDAAPVGPLGRWLHEPDGAVLRAGLVAAVAAEVGGHLLDPRIAYVTSDRLVPSAVARSYEVLEAMPFQLKRLRAALRRRGAGDVVVKKRGSAIEPAALRRQLRLRGDGPTATVVLTRLAGEPWVLLVEPAG